jgi:hypothetical protein
LKIGGKIEIGGQSSSTWNGSASQTQRSSRQATDRHPKQVAAMQTTQSKHNKASQRHSRYRSIDDDDEVFILIYFDLDIRSSEYRRRVPPTQYYLVEPSREK